MDEDEREADDLQRFQTMRWLHGEEEPAEAECMPIMAEGMPAVAAELQAIGAALVRPLDGRPRARPSAPLEVRPSLRWADCTPSQEEQVPADQREALFERLAAVDFGMPDADGASKRAELRCG